MHSPAIDNHSDNQETSRLDVHPKIDKEFPWYSQYDEADQVYFLILDLLTLKPKKHILNIKGGFYFCQGVG